jgi:RimJ/RimL family protein N-acetyltransferase
MTTSIPHPLTLADAEAFLARMEDRDPEREALFAIEASDSPEPRGLVGLLGFHPGEAGAPEMGYWLGRPFWGRGLMTEAVRAALVWASEAWGRRFVPAGHFTDNLASGAVLIKAGFLYTGEIRVRFSMARGEPAATRMMIWLA